MKPALPLHAQPELIELIELIDRATHWLWKKSTKAIQMLTLVKGKNAVLIPFQKHHDVFSKTSWSFFKNVMEFF